MERLETEIKKESSQSEKENVHRLVFHTLLKSKQVSESGTRYVVKEGAGGYWRSGTNLHICLWSSVIPRQNSFPPNGHGVEEIKLSDCCCGPLSLNRMDDKACKLIHKWWSCVFILRVDTTRVTSPNKEFIRHA